MSANLVGAGHTVRGFDPVPAAAATAAAGGVEVFDSAADAVAEADVVITMLPNGDIVKRCYAEVLPAARAGCAVHRQLDDLGQRRPRGALAGRSRTGFRSWTPRSPGGVKGAVAGTLAFMVGGDEAAVQRARPVLEPMAGKIIHCGAAGAGQAAKVCNNMVLAVQQIAVGEAFVLAEKLGLSAQSLFDVITGATGNCWAVHTNCPVPGPVPTSPANNDFKPGFATALMNKDLGLAMDAVSSTGSAAPLGTHAAEIYAKFAADHARLGLQRGHRDAAQQLTLVCDHVRPGTSRVAVARSEVAGVAPQRLDRRHQRLRFGSGHADVGEHLLVERDGGVLDGGPAQIGDLHQRGAPVGGMRYPLNQPVGLQPADRVGDAGDVNLQPVGGLGDRQRSGAAEREQTAATRTGRSSGHRDAAPSRRGPAGSDAPASPRSPRPCPATTSPQPARSQLARAAAIGSRFSVGAATPFLTALAGRSGPTRPDSARLGHLLTAASTARVDARLPTVIRAPPSG